MTAKLSPDSVGLIFSMHSEGYGPEEIAEKIGCAYSTVIRYLNAGGIVLGNKGRPKQLTSVYMDIALDMRAKGKRWADVEFKLGFSRRTFQGQLHAMRVQP